jgi:ABC-type multidrug transport system ATPase subunit
MLTVKKEETGLEIRNVTLSRGGRPVMLDCSVEAGPGEAVALVGPNGSGKTTLLHYLSGLLAADSGTLACDGRTIDPASAEWRRRTAFVLDDGGTLPLLTVQEQLSLAAALSEIAPAEAAGRVDEVIRLLQLESHRHHRGEELSSGLRKRLGIGIGIIRNAGVFLFDEPFGALDVEGAVAFVGIIGLLKDKGRIVIFASHTLPFADSLLSRIWRLSAGRAEDLPNDTAVRRPFVEALQAHTPRLAAGELPWIG